MFTSDQTIARPRYQAGLWLQDNGQGKMPVPVRLLTTKFFYATGNTPAVCLTHSLPPDQDVSLLLLGCGDVRNVLFTAYADLGSGKFSKFLKDCITFASTNI